MCACENAYVCERCRDTPDDPYYCDNEEPDTVPIAEGRSDAN